MRESHLWTLRALLANEKWNPDWAFTYRYIMEEIPDGFHLNQIVKAMKLLRRERLAHYTHTFTEDDCLACGSGHQITEKGKAVLAELEALIVTDPANINKAKQLYEETIVAQGRSPGFDAPTWSELSQKEQAKWLEKATS